jgi:hypothetical protein
VVALDGDTLSLEIATDVVVKVSRAAVQRLAGAEEMKVSKPSAIVKKR